MSNDGYQALGNKRIETEETSQRIAIVDAICKTSNDNRAIDLKIQISIKYVSVVNVTSISTTQKNKVS